MNSRSIYIHYFVYICAYNCTTIGYVRLHASIAGKQAQPVGFSRIIKIFCSHGKLCWFIGQWIICFCYRKWCTWSWKWLWIIYPIVWFICRKGCTWSWISLLFMYLIAWFSCRQWYKWLLKFVMLTYWVKYLITMVFVLFYLLTC